MMNLLAAASTAGDKLGKMDWITVPRQWPAQIDLLDWCQTMSPGTAALLIFLGMIFLLFGIQLFKPLVMMNAAVVGAYLGAILGHRGNAAVVGAIIGALLAAAVVWPMLKWAVAVMGGTLGAVVGASVWRSCNLDPAFVWSGALTGMVLMGMLSFILFRASLMMYTSLQGSVMLILGLLGLIFKYQDVAPSVRGNMLVHHLILPAAILVPALIGIIYQQTQYGGATQTSGSGSGGGSGGHGGSSSGKK